MESVSCLLCPNPASIVVGVHQVPGEEYAFFSLHTKLPLVLKKNPRFCQACFDMNVEVIENKEFVRNSLKQFTRK